MSNQVSQMVALSFLFSIGYDNCQHVHVLFYNFEERKSLKTSNSTPSIEGQSLGSNNLELAKVAIIVKMCVFLFF